MSLTQKIARQLFQLLAAAGRPFGGIRPHRLAHQLSQVAFGGRVPTAAEFRWYSDAQGLMLKLHPYYLIDREIIAFGGYELPLQRFIKKNIRSGMICMDVGANMGAMALHMALRVGETGKVFAFEPLPTNAQRLREHSIRNGFENRLHLLQIALSNADGDLEFLAAPTSHVNQGMGSLVEIDHGDLTARIVVQARRLDTFCISQSIKKLDFVKVDIQGAEPHFLAGARQTLAHLRPRLVMEVAPSGLSSSGHTSQDLLSQMEALGYHAYVIKPSGDKGIRLTAAQCSPGFTAESVLFEPQTINNTGSSI